jgi:hypothetical protein
MKIKVGNVQAEHYLQGSLALNKMDKVVKCVEITSDYLVYEVRSSVSQRACVGLLRDLWGVFN